MPRTRIAGSRDNSVFDWFLSSWWVLFSCFLAGLVVLRTPAVVTFTLSGAGWFCCPTHIPELCSWTQFIYLETVILSGRPSKICRAGREPCSDRGWLFLPPQGRPCCVHPVPWTVRFPVWLVVQALLPAQGRAPILLTARSWTSANWFTLRADQHSTGLRNCPPVQLSFLGTPAAGSPQTPSSVSSCQEGVGAPLAFLSLAEAPP